MLVTWAKVAPAGMPDEVIRVLIFSVATQMPEHFPP